MLILICNNHSKSPLLLSISNSSDVLYGTCIVCKARCRTSKQCLLALSANNPPPEFNV